VHKPDPYGEWVILGSKQGADKAPYPLDEELLAAARAAWPHVLAHARRELSDTNFGPDRNALAVDVWESMLRSVARTRQRKSGPRPPISDLQAYLIGAFHHRFNRVLKREHKRLETIEAVASSAELERLEGARDTDWVSELEQAITVKQIIRHMDEWTKRVWRARQYGYSWKEISTRLGLNEQQTKMRFHRELEKIRQAVTKVSRKWKIDAKDQS
jgi:RNA polymerase sigma factor (sigma-70 family)